MVVKFSTEDCSSRRIRYHFGGRFSEVALCKTIRHHAHFVAKTNEPPGWISRFREIVLDVRVALDDLRGHMDAVVLFAPRLARVTGAWRTP